MRIIVVSMMQIKQYIYT